MSIFNKLIACFTGPITPPAIDDDQKSAIQNTVNKQPLKQLEVNKQATQNITPLPPNSTQINNNNNNNNQTVVVKPPKVVCNGDVCVIQDEDEEEEMVSWDSNWDEEEGKSNPESSSHTTNTSKPNSPFVSPNFLEEKQTEQTAEVEDEEDYFADMTPVFKPTIVGIIDEEKERESAKKKFAIAESHISNISSWGDDEIEDLDEKKDKRKIEATKGVKLSFDD